MHLAQLFKKKLPKKKRAMLSIADFSVLTIQMLCYVNNEIMLLKY